MIHNAKKLFSILAAGLMIFATGTGIVTPAAAAPSTAEAQTAQQPRFQGPNGKFRVYLSPSCQPWNTYIDGSGSEEYHMRRVANAMLPYLQSYDIEFVLAAPQTSTSANQKATLQARANEARNNGCDLYLAIHSNAANHNSRGTRIYYYTKDAESKRFANVIASNYIYPDKNKIGLTYNDRLMEMYMPSMPRVLVETAFHDNYDDAYWIQANIDGIAQSLAKSVNDFRNGAAGGVSGSSSMYVSNGISLDRIMADLPKGTAIVLQPSSTTTGSRFEYGQVNWSSSNPSVATVDMYGTVIGVNPGSAVITARVGGATATCEITVLSGDPGLITATAPAPESGGFLIVEAQ